MKNYLVSVIVPTFNRPNMLVKALESVLGQSFRNFEIIVVNDAGQDVSSLIHSFNSSKITLITHKNNKGLAAARNTGIQAAQGKYIAYLDDDDLYYPNHLEVLVNFLEKSEYAVAYTDAYKAIQEKSGDGFVTVERQAFPSNDFDYDAILIDNFIPVLCVIHEKACLDTCGNFDETLPRHEDWELWIRMSRSFRFGHVSTVTCEFTYRSDGSGMTSGTLPMFLETYRRIYDKYALVTKDRPDLRQRQKSGLFRAAFRAYTFLAERMACYAPIIATLEGTVLAELLKTGASSAQLQSVQMWQQALLTDDSSAINLLSQALDLAPDNGPARVELFSRYLKLNQQPDALQQVQILHEQDPLQTDFALTLAKLQDVIGGVGSPKSRSKIKKVAVLSLDQPQNACALIRLLLPLSACGYEVVWAASVNGAQCTTDFDAIDSADLIVVQRFYPRLGTLDYLERILSAGKPVIYELDDLIADVPDDNHLKPWIKETADLLPTLLPRFSAITVSAEALAVLCRAYNPNVYVLPNLIDEQLWQASASPVVDRPVVIGFAGTATHRADLQALEPALFRIADKYGDSVAFRFMGDYTPACKELPGFSYIPFTESYRDYAAQLPLAGFDIAIVPLQDNPFNRAKSNIKWLEYSACGIAGVYADLSPYNNCIKHGETGLLAGNEPEQWFRAISLLIENSALRQRLATNARHEVLTNYNLRSAAQYWGQVYGDIFKRHEIEGLAQSKETTQGGYSNWGESDVPAAVVSIIIPVFNQLHFTKQCLQALFETLPSTIVTEVIVVDNGSSDSTDVYLRSLGEQVRVISNAVNLGFAKACNQGARAAHGEYLLFLNNDTVPQSGWLEPLLNAVQSGVADISGARLLYPDGRCQHAGIAFDERGLGYHIFGGFPGDAPEVLERRQMQAVTGACLLLGKLLFEELEGFDEGFQNGCEDVDLCLRAGNSGKRVFYVPESVVTHHAEQTPGRKDYDIPNLEHFFRRWSGNIRQDDQQLYRRFGLASSRDESGRFTVSRADTGGPKVSIIIPLFNQSRLTEGCVSAIQRFTQHGGYELILIDNASSDGTADLLEQWRQTATIIRNLENLGFAKACNQGARAARGDYLLFLNNDTEVTVGWLEPLSTVFEQDSTVAAVGSKLLYSDGTIQHAGVLLVEDRQQRDPLVGRHLYQRMPGDHPAANVMRTVQALTAACLLVRREDFEAVGGFDEGYWNGYEDVDLCLKLTAAGKRLVYQPASVVVHHESQSGPERFRQAAANIRRLHERWLGKVQVDAIIQVDGMIQHGPGILKGITAIYQPAVVRATDLGTQQNASASPRQYQLVPLVSGSASSLLQRLASSRRTRDVLQRYTVDA